MATGFGLEKGPLSSCYLHAQQSVLAYGKKAILVFVADIPLLVCCLVRTAV